MVELVAALAIVSLVTLTLFQSTRQWLALSARSANAAERAFGDLADQTIFATIVGGLIPGWPEFDDEIFFGTPEGFAGLTRRPAEGGGLGLQTFSLTVSRNRDGRSTDDGRRNGGVVTYQSQNNVWDIIQLDGAPAEFAYLGSDGLWRPSWPPEINPTPDPLNDAASLPVPQLPQAIKMTINAEARPRIWIAQINSTPFTASRDQDLFSSQQGLSQ